MTPEQENDYVLLSYIRQCIERIRTYSSEGRAAFFDSTMVQDAVVRNLQTLAESTQRLSSSLKATESGVSWDAIAGFRNVLVHNYLGMDLELVWSVVEIDLPELGAAIERMTQVLASARTRP